MRSKFAWLVNQGVTWRRCILFFLLRIICEKIHVVEVECVYYCDVITAVCLRAWYCFNERSLRGPEGFEESRRIPEGWNKHNVTAKQGPRGSGSNTVSSVGSLYDHCMYNTYIKVYGYVCLCMDPGNDVHTM